MAHPIAVRPVRDADIRTWRIAFALIAALWLGQYALLTIERIAVLGEYRSDMIVPRLLVTAAAMAISLGVARIIFAMHKWRWPVQIAIGLGCALLATLLHAACNLAAFHFLLPPALRGEVDLAAYAPPMLQWFWSYFGLIGMLMAIRYALRVTEGERRITRLERSEHEAQLRALRYQLNPHFMFNAMNSIVALIGERRLDEAETMVENLSDFFRRTLDLAPDAEISVAEEVELQQLYLEVERLRFGDRLQVEFIIDPEAAAAIVPALITQPLVENVVRHALSTSSRPVRLSTEAYREGDDLILIVRNTDGGGARQGGGGVGLANVAARLQSRYGKRAGFECGAADGEFRARLRLPLRT